MQPTRLWEWTEEHAADEDEEEKQSWKAKIHTAKDTQLVLIATVQPLIVSNNDLSHFTLATDTIHVLYGSFNDIKNQECQNNCWWRALWSSVSVRMLTRLLVHFAVQQQWSQQHEARQERSDIHKKSVCLCMEGFCCFNPRQTHILLGLWERGGLNG